LQSKHFIMTINVNLNITFDKVIKIIFSSFNKKLNTIMSKLEDFQDKLAAIAANQEAQSASIAEIQSDIAELKNLIENGGMSAADEATALGLIDSILNKSNESRRLYRRLTNSCQSQHRNRIQSHKEKFLSKPDGCCCDGGIRFLNFKIL
jgi:chromosome segregation ATPase